MRSLPAARDGASDAEPRSGRSRGGYRPDASGRFRAAGLELAALGLALDLLLRVGVRQRVGLFDLRGQVVLTLHAHKVAVGELRPLLANLGSERVHLALGRRGSLLVGGGDGLG